MRRTVILAAALVVAALVAAQTRVQGPAIVRVPTVRGPVSAGESTPTTTPVSSTTTTTGVPFMLPVAGPSDVNCAGPTIPPSSGALSPSQDVAIMMQTCATGANPAGYRVNSVSAYVRFASGSPKIKCSIYSNDAPTGTRTKLADGCDTVEVVPATNPSAYVLMATSGTCVLAPSTRYAVACTANNSSTQFGLDTTACSGAGNCQVSYAFTPFTTAWPATFTSGSSTTNRTIPYYLTIAGL